MADDEMIELLESTELSHREYLAEFKEKVYPIFEPYGFTFPEAYQYWALNKIENMCERIVELLDQSDA